MTSWADRIYTLSPVFVQNWACGLHGRKERKLRYGGAFHEFLNWLERTQWWSRAQIEEYQAQQLQKLVRHVYDTVPYYRRLLDGLKLTPNDIRSRADLPKLPVLTKEDVATHRDELLSKSFSRKEVVFCHTSGTSGKSLQFYMEPRAFQFRWAVWWRFRRRFGIQFDAPYATFTGLTAVPLNQKKAPFWREDKPMHQTVFTMHHIVREKVPAIVGRLNRGGFEYYSGYPSILYLLAGLILDLGLEIVKPPAMVFTGAENLYEDQRALMEKVYKCPITDLYGFSEGSGNASRCPDDNYHEDFEYGILECDRPETIDAGTVRGRILATGFGGYAMPFLRYEVGDIGVWQKGSCPCGRHSEVMRRIEGRVEDYVITPEGRRIMRFDYIFKDTHNVREAQVVQSELGSICIRVVRRPAFSVTDEAYICDQIRRAVSESLHVRFEYVNEIERDASGKFRAVSSQLR